MDKGDESRLMGVFVNWGARFSCTFSGNRVESGSDPLRPKTDSGFFTTKDG
jgi:hypothetical protein